MGVLDIIPDAIKLLWPNQRDQANFAFFQEAFKAAQNESQVATNTEDLVAAIASLSDQLVNVLEAFEGFSFDESNNLRTTAAFPLDGTDLSTSDQNIKDIISSGRLLSSDENSADILEAFNTFLSNGLSASENHIGEVGGRTTMIGAEFTRPNDSGTNYAANDVVSTNATTTTPIELANFARVNGESGYIVGARLTTNKKSITPRIRVHLFSDSTATVSADNAQWQEKYADIDKRIGYFDLPAMTTGADATNSDMSRSLDFSLRVPFKCATASRSVYYVLETLDGFVQDANQKFTLTLYGELN